LNRAAPADFAGPRHGLVEILESAEPYLAVRLFRFGKEIPQQDAKNIKASLFAVASRLWMNASRVAAQRASGSLATALAFTVSSKREKSRG
jgi:hypothetical protein